MIEISVNGEHKRIDAALTLALALTQWNYECARVAVAINSEFVPRADYAVRTLAAGDCVDVVAPVAGG
jgi:sulfur carrier protein